MGNSGEHFDVIVVGAGIMGSTTAYQIAKRRHKVLLLEQFDFLHHRGSSHGESRTLTANYPKDYYLPLVLESRRLWEEAESEIGYHVYTQTPQLDVGPIDSNLQLVIANCRSNSIPVQVLDPEELTEKFAGMFRLPQGWIGVLTEIGGVIKPTKAVSMFQTLAIRRGAVLRDRMEVIGIKKDEERGGVCVSTEGGSEYWGRKCVVTAGTWMTKLVKSVSGLVLPIQPLQTTICYWKIKEGHKRELTPENGFPTFASYGDQYIFGTPSMEFPGLIKIGLHGGYPCDPDNRNWETDMGRLQSSVIPWIEELMPGCVESGKPIMTQSCMYSMTPDGDFIIDFLGGEFGDDVIVGGGFSGHGFKMGPVVGRILADLVLNGDKALNVELSHFRLGRFEEDCKGEVKERGIGLFG